MLNDIYYTYVLFSEKDKNFYVGYTHNVALRFEQHCGGQVDSTKNRRPLLLIYFEGGLDKQDALNREKYLKTFYGRMFLGKRLKSYFTRLHNETSHNNPENR